MVSQGKKFYGLLLIFVAALCHAQPGSNPAEPSVGITLGQTGDLGRTKPVLLPETGSWSEQQKDGDRTFRSILPGKSVQVLLVAFDVDSAGLPRHDMALEVEYRDDHKASKTDQGSFAGRTIVETRLDFSRDNESLECGHFGGAGDHKWKTARILIQRSPRQMLRAIDGAFHFRIITPRDSSDPSPIASIRLKAVDHDRFLLRLEEDRAARGLSRVDYTPASRPVNPPAKWAGLGFVVCPVNCMQLVFPNSPPDYAGAGRALSCFELPGETEPVSFVLYAFRDMRNIGVQASDLRSKKGSIPAACITARPVVITDQRWGWATEGRYGKCPDYLGFADSVMNLKRGALQQFWLNIAVPDNAASGSYEGQVAITEEGKTLYEIPLSLEVLPIHLRRGRVEHPVFHSPYVRDYDRDTTKVLRDMKAHGLTPIYIFEAGLVRENNRMPADINPLRRQLREFREVYPEETELFLSVREHYRVWEMLGGPKPGFQTRFPQFEETYGNILSGYGLLAKRMNLNLHLSFVDEPNDWPSSRRIAYLCSKLARDRGIKTWSTISLAQYDVQLPLEPSNLAQQVNYLRPLAEVLDDAVMGIRGFDDASIGQMSRFGAGVSYYTTYLATSVRPMFNRFLHGWYPFAAGSRYVFSYAYRDAICDPYDDMDSTGKSNEWGNNDYLLTYPSWQGDILPTLSYEGLREGVEDSRIISMLEDLADEAASGDDERARKLAAEARGFINEVEKRLSRDFVQTYWKKHRALPEDPMEAAILADICGESHDGYAAFDRLRRGVCDRIINLQRLGKHKPEN
jgi:hypothetical protein